MLALLPSLEYPPGTRLFFKDNTEFYLHYFYFPSMIYFIRKVKKKGLSL